MPYCVECGEFIRETQEHRCPPAWSVWPDSADEAAAVVVRSENAAAAALKWAEIHDTNRDFLIFSGPGKILNLRGENGRLVHAYLMGDYEPGYIVTDLIET